MKTDKQIRVGIIGLGRSGWDIHRRVISHQAKLFTITAFYDPISSRRREAALV
ncbi:MAG: hypothetical protein ACLFST_07735 [Spirochaetia bacterium]